MDVAMTIQQNSYSLYLLHTHLMIYKHGEKFRKSQREPGKSGNLATGPPKILCQAVFDLRHSALKNFVNREKKTIEQSWNFILKIPRKLGNFKILEKLSASQRFVSKNRVSYKIVEDGLTCFRGRQDRQAVKTQRHHSRVVYVFWSTSRIEGETAVCVILFPSSRLCFLQIFKLKTPFSDVSHFHQ